MASSPYSVVHLLSRSSKARKLVLGTPLVRDVAGHFVGGDDLQSAISTVRAFNGLGIKATMNYHGMHTADPGLASRAADEAIAALQAIKREGLDANVSVKLTLIGLDISREFCTDQLDRVLATAAETGGFVRIDMEESPYLDDTLSLYDSMSARWGKGTVGIVLQSYLRHRRADLDHYAALGARIRLVKGGCREPASVAYQRKHQIDAAYMRDIERLLSVGESPAIASHDANAIQWAKTCQERLGLPLHAVEFQMLQGVKAELLSELAKERRPVRVYVPYGNTWPSHVLSNLRLMLGGRGISDRSRTS
jgi:proline dehydrogenase